MDFHSVLANREARKERGARPYENFRENSDKCISAAKDLVSETEKSRHVDLLERATIIAFVTYVEVYFRDMLDTIFKYCDPEFFLPQLKHIHNQKYDIEEVLEIFRLQIHPLELISSEYSFQNIDRIEKVFSKFLKKGLWSEAINLKVRVKDSLTIDPKMVVTFEPEYLKALGRILSLRHELVHNPRRSRPLNEAVLTDMKNADGIIFAANIILENMLGENQDPALKTENKQEQDG